MYTCMYMYFYLYNRKETPDENTESDNNYYYNNY